jgi:hypothetical protein
MSWIKNIFYPKSCHPEKCDELTYDGPPLSCIDVQTNTFLNEIIKSLDAMLCEAESRAIQCCPTTTTTTTVAPLNSLIMAESGTYCEQTTFYSVPFNGYPYYGIYANTSGISPVNVGFVWYNPDGLPPYAPGWYWTNVIGSTTPPSSVNAYLQWTLGGDQPSSPLIPINGDGWEWTSLKDSISYFAIQTETCPTTTSTTTPPP